MAPAHQGKTMEVTMISLITGQANTRTIETDDPDRLLRWLQEKDPEHIQRAFPNMSPDDREFLISGTTPEDWELVFGPDDPDPEDIDEPPCDRPEGPHANVGMETAP